MQRILQGLLHFLQGIFMSISHFLHQIRIRHDNELKYCGRMPRSFGVFKIRTSRKTDEPKVRVFRITWLLIHNKNTRKNQHLQVFDIILLKCNFYL